MHYKATIIGAGEMGRALRSILLSSNLVEVELWDVDASKVPQQKALEVVVNQADFIFFCVNSWNLRSALQSVKEKVEKGHQPAPIILSKGMEEKTWLTTDEITDEVWGQSLSYALLGGPMLAEDLETGLGGAVVVASMDQTLYARLEHIFSATAVHSEYSYDVHGVALMGVLKNVYAIILGMAQALPVGSNQLGILVQRSFAEITAIADNLGSRQTTAWGTAGLADYIATGFSKGSANYSLGCTLIHSGKILQPSEGSRAIVSLKHLIEQHSGNGIYPLLNMVAAAVKNPEKARPIFTQYLEGK